MVRVSQASAEQRRGRAGRTGPGLCLRLWSAQERLEVGALSSSPPLPPPFPKEGPCWACGLLGWVWGGPDKSKDWQPYKNSQTVVLVSY